MTYKAIPCVSSLILGGINAKTVAATKIVTTDPNMRFACYQMFLEATVLTGAATGPTFSIGTNATNYNNLLASNVWSPTTQKQFRRSVVLTTAITVAPNTDIYINITSGSTSTTFTLRVMLSGVYC